MAEALSTHRDLVALLFRLMGDKRTVDNALTLAQELLAVGPDVFPLDADPSLVPLIESLLPRGLALVGRALAVLLAKSAEQSTEGVPAPECVAPDLCASCANNKLLVGIPSLLPRIVALLRLKAPPPGLGGHMLAQFPHGLGIFHSAYDEPECEWEQLREAAARPAMAGFHPEAVPPALRDLFVHAANAPLLIAEADGAGVLHLADLHTALWSTLQADLLYVLWALMGGKTKEQAQSALVDLGLLDVLSAMFERLDWRPPRVPHQGQHGPGCSCSAQSCLQMQLLRTLQALCEKESGATSFHRLLAPSNDGAPTEGGGLLHRVIALLLEQPAESIYTLGLASCVHKWVQASSVEEQRLVAAHPGLIDYALQQLVSQTPPPEPQLQIFFDLIAEMCKFNPPLLRETQQRLGSGADGAERTRIFVGRLLGQPVDASICIQSIVFTLHPTLSPLRGHRAVADLARLGLISDDLGLTPRVAESGGEDDASDGRVGARVAGAARAAAGAVLGTGSRGRCARCAECAESCEQAVHAVECQLAECQLAECHVSDASESYVVRGAPMEAEASGALVDFLRTHEGEVLLQLMGGVTVDAMSVETMCVINASLSFFLVAQHAGRRTDLLRSLLAHARASCADLGVFAAFRELLNFWSSVYDSHSCEREFLTFSSGVPFATWRQLVTDLRQDLAELAPRDSVRAVE